jgi:protein deglycase
MRKEILIVIADGVEEMEAVIPADVLRRAGAEVTFASIHNLTITAARGVKLVADKTLAECQDEKYDVIIIPGGMPGAENLRDNKLLAAMLKKQAEAGKLIAAICASPVVVLQHHGLLKGKMATCHPAMWNELENIKQDRVVVDGNIITSQGPGTAAEFALKLVVLLFDQAKADNIAQAMVIKKN